MTAEQRELIVKMFDAKIERHVRYGSDIRDVHYVEVVRMPVVELADFEAFILEIERRVINAN